MPRNHFSLNSIIGISMALLFLAGTAMAAGPKEIVIHSFAGGPTDGASPYATLVADRGGNLYGTTPSGGASGLGTIFKLAPQSNGTFTETILFNFTSQGVGNGSTQASLTLDGKGNLYGTSTYGGVYGRGFVFELSPSSTGWKFSDLYDFQFDGLTNFDAANPLGSLIRDRNGNLYGTTLFGGTGPCQYNGPASVAPAPPKGQTPTGCGTVFKLSPSSSGVWTEKVVYSFQGGADGGLPAANLTLDATGNLFGTTSEGGQGGASCGSFYDYGCGVVFELSPAGGGTWNETALYAFTGGSDGAQPFAGVIFDTAGNLYGTTAGQYSEFGSVFELSPTSSGTWTETTILSFINETYGYGAAGSLFLDRAGNLFGTTQYGVGPTGSVPPPKPGGPGTIFELSPAQGGTWTTNWLHTFAGAPDGSNPTCALIRGPNGALYGTTSTGGSGYGTVFKFFP